MFGLIKFYNRPTVNAFDAKSPKMRQLQLQNVAKDAAKAKAANWQIMFHAS